MVHTPGVMGRQEDCRYCRKERVHPRNSGGCGNARCRKHPGRRPDTVVADGNAAGKHRPSVYFKAEGLALVRCNPFRVARGTMGIATGGGASLAARLLLSEAFGLIGAGVARDDRLGGRPLRRNVGYHEDGRLGVPRRRREVGRYVRLERAQSGAEKMGEGQACRSRD
jgi:hypothetical protein